MDEKNLSAKENPPEERAWFPETDGYEEWPEASCPPSCEGP